MFQQELQNYVTQNPDLVKMKEVAPGMFVLKYTKKVFYKGLWNQYLEECRGTIVDEDFNVIQRPFTKIYNYGVEKQAPVLSDDTEITAFEKINGFMVAVTWHKGNLLVSTTGSVESPFVDMAMEYINQVEDGMETMCEFYKDFTWLFECCHPNDPHIIQQEPGLYLLGCRRKSWGPESLVVLDECATLGYVEAFNTYRGVNVVKAPKMFRTTVGELKKMVKSVRHEGFVFYTASGVAAKIKSPYYLMAKWVARNPNTDKLMDLKNDIKERIEEEFYPLVDKIRENIEEYTALDEQSRLAWVRKQLGE